MNASFPALPEPTLAAWSRTARPIRLQSIAAPSSYASRTHGTDDTDQVDDLMFGCSAAALMAMPLIFIAATLAG